MSYIDLYKDADRVMPIEDHHRRAKKKAPRRRPAAAPMPGMGDFGFSFKRLVRKAAGGVKSVGRGVGRGVGRVARTGLKVAQYTTPVGLAYTAGRAAVKHRRGLLKVAGKALKYGTAPGLAYTGLKLGKKLLKKKPSRKLALKPARPDQQLPDQDLEQTQAPEEMQTEAEETPPDVDQGGDDQGGDDQGGDDQGGDDAGSDAGGDDDGASADDDAQTQAEMEGLGLLEEGMGFSPFKALKSVGRGIGRGAKATGGFLGKAGASVGKVGGQIALTAARTYLGQQLPSEGGGGGGPAAGGGGHGGGINWKSPLVIGGGAVLVLGGLALAMRGRGKTAGI